MPFGDECKFQFPLHRDPSCNPDRFMLSNRMDLVSVPFTSGPFLQPQLERDYPGAIIVFQFPLHRDPSCNWMRPPCIWMRFCFSSLYIGTLPATDSKDAQRYRLYCFSSLYIGTLPATLLLYHLRTSEGLFQFPLHRDPSCNEGEKYHQSDE